MDSSYIPVFLALLVFHIVWDMFKFAFWTPRPAATLKAIEQIAANLVFPSPQPCCVCAGVKSADEKNENVIVHVLSRQSSPALHPSSPSKQCVLPPSLELLPPRSLSLEPDS